VFLLLLNKIPSVSIEMKEEAHAVGESVRIQIPREQAYLRVNARNYFF
jgi:hypothetical protein